MSARTLGIWRAYYEIDPWDENRADLRAGEIAAAVAGAAGAKKFDGSFFSPVDFMRYLKLQQDPDELAREHDAQVSASLRQWLLNNSGHKARDD